MKTLTPTQERHELQLEGLIIDLTIVRSQKRKRTIAFSVTSKESLQIVAPMKTSLPTIKKILLSRKKWILHKLQEQNYVIKETKRQFIEGERFFYLGEMYLLAIERTTKMPAQCYLSEQSLLLTLPSHYESHFEQHLVKAQLKTWYLEQAKLIFQERIAFWSQHMAIPFKQLLITNPKRQWGSCDPQNVIRLNWRLIMTPLSIIDYVIVHELAHVIHKNHATSFWQLVASFMPDYKERRQYLKQFSRQYEF